jgi:hypothetical protein
VVGADTAPDLFWNHASIAPSLAKARIAQDIGDFGDFGD